MWLPNYGIPKFTSKSRQLSLLNSKRVFTLNTCTNASNLAVKMCVNDNGWCNGEKTSYIMVITNQTNVLDIECICLKQTDKQLKRKWQTKKCMHGMWLVLFAMDRLEPLNGNRSNGCLYTHSHT